MNKNPVAIQKNTQEIQIFFSNIIFLKLNQQRFVEKLIKSLM